MFRQPPALFSSFGGTVKTLAFLRNTPTQDAVTKEEKLNFTAFATYRVDVQPVDGTRPINAKLTELYVQVYQLTFENVVDLNRADRVVIDGAECIIENVEHWGGHTEALAGARQGGTI